MPRKSEIVVPTTAMKSKDRASARRHTYAATDKNALKDLFEFSMHATQEFYDDILLSPTPDDMYTDDSFNGEDDSFYGALSSLPLLSLDEEKEENSTSASASTNTGRRESLSRSKSKKLKKRKSKRLSSDSQSSKTSSSTKSKRLSSDSQSSKTSSSTKSKSKSKSIKSKKSKTPETKSVAAMLKKLEEYEETLEEERRLLQKEREDIAMEREALQLKSCELESKLDELDDDKHMKKMPSSRSIHNEELRLENAILLERLQRQDGIILQLSNMQGETKGSNCKEDESNEVSRLEKELSQAKELICKNEKIIKGQKLTIDRMKKESANSSFTLPMVGAAQKKDDGTVATTLGDSFSSLEDSFSSLFFTSDEKPRRVERASSSSSIGRMKNMIKLPRTTSSRETFRNRIATPEEVTLSSLVESM